MDGIYIGTPSKDEIKRYFSRATRNESLPSDTRSDGDQAVEMLTSEEELSESYEEFLKKSLADKKTAKEQVDFLKTSEDPASVTEMDKIANDESDVSTTLESSVIVEEEEMIAEVEPEVVADPEDAAVVEHAKKLATKVTEDPAFVEQIQKPAAEAAVTPNALSDPNTVELTAEDPQVKVDPQMEVDHQEVKEDAITPLSVDSPSIIEQLEESATNAVDVSMAPDDDSPTVASRNWIVNSSIVITTPTVGDRKMFLQRCFKKSSKNESNSNQYDVNASFMEFIQKKKQELKKPKTIVEGETEGSNEM